MNPKLMWILIALSALTALSIDIYLPSMQGMADEFGVSMAQVQAGLSLFVIGFAFGQLALGPLSDRYGRRKPLLAGIALFFISSLICALAQNIILFLIARFVQGISASCGTVSAMAIVRDLCSGSDMTRIFARMATAVGVAPILAPNLGAFMAELWNWRASFYFLAVFGCVLAFLVVGYLPETSKPHARETSTRWLQGFIGIGKNPVFIQYTIVYSLGFAALFCFITTAGPLLMKGLGLSAQVFAIIFASNALIYIAASFVASRLSGRLSLPTMALVGSLCLIVGGVAMLTLSVWHSLWALMLPMYSVTLGVAWLLPSGSSGALQPFADRAGRATALQGFIRFVVAAGAAFLVSLFSDTSQVALAVAILGCGLVSLLAALSALRFRSLTSLEAT